MFLDIFDLPLDREATFSPCEKFSENLPRLARGNARLCIIFFPLDDLINFFKEYTLGFKEKVTRFNNL